MIFQIAEVMLLIFSAVYCENDGTMMENDGKVSEVLKRLDGVWKEDLTKREGFEEFLIAAGADEKARKAILCPSRISETTYKASGNSCDMLFQSSNSSTGSEKIEITVDNITATHIVYLGFDMVRSF